VGVIIIREMVGTSPRSWSDAARQAVATASNTRSMTARTRGSAYTRVSSFGGPPRSRSVRMTLQSSSGSRPPMWSRCWWLTKTSRTVDPGSSQNPSALTINQESKTQVQNISANTTAQVSGKLHARLAFNDSWSKVKGLLPSLNGMLSIRVSDKISIRGSR